MSVHPPLIREPSIMSTTSGEALGNRIGAAVEEEMAQRVNMNSIQDVSDLSNSKIYKTIV